MAAMSEQPGRYQRSFAGMVGALVVLLLVIAAFVIFRETNRNELVNPVDEVDFLEPATYARQVAAFPLLVPTALPEGWIATSVRFDIDPPQLWHLGTLTEQEKYVGLEQAALPVSTMVEDHVDEDAEEGEPVTIAGAEWQTFTDEGGDLAVVRRDRGSTTVVLGRVPLATLEEFVRTLR